MVLVECLVLLVVHGVGVGGVFEVLVECLWCCWWSMMSVVLLVVVVVLVSVCGAVRAVGGL